MPTARTGRPPPRPSGRGADGAESWEDPCGSSWPEEGNGSEVGEQGGSPAAGSRVGVYARFGYNTGRPLPWVVPMPPLVPNRFLVRVSHPCPHVKAMPLDGDDKLLDLPESARLNN